MHGKMLGWAHNKGFLRNRMHLVIGALARHFLININGWSQSPC